jgi:hypothetical protein
MLLLEAARQAALATAHPDTVTVTGMDSDFVRYAEMDVPCWVEAEQLADPGQVRISARQNGKEIFASVVTLTAVAAPRGA